MSVNNHQQEICSKFGSKVLPSNFGEKVGIALNTLGNTPINALRSKPENGTCGWYIWCGETFSEDENFFQPLHVSHLDKYVPEILPYLSLAVGWRVLLAQNYEDVWFDETLFLQKN